MPETLPTRIAEHNAFSTVNIDYVPARVRLKALLADHGVTTPEHLYSGKGLHALIQTGWKQCSPDVLRRYRVVVAVDAPFRFPSGFVRFLTEYREGSGPPALCF